MVDIWIFTLKFYIIKMNWEENLLGALKPSSSSVYINYTTLLVQNNPIHYTFK